MVSDPISDYFCEFSDFLLVAGAVPAVLRVTGIFKFGLLPTKLLDVMAWAVLGITAYTGYRKWVLQECP